MSESVEEHANNHKPMSISGPQADVCAPTPEPACAADPRARIRDTVPSALYTMCGPLSLVLVLLGGGLQGYAQDAVGAVYVGFIFLFVGFVVSGIVFRWRKPEVRAFLISYAVCVFAGGMAQCYSLWAFGEAMSTLDARNFFGALLERPPYYSWYTLQHTWLVATPVGRGTPLAVQIWQYLYRFFLPLGFSFGPYIAILFNAAIVGLTGSFTVATGRLIFGDDEWRLRRILTLHAICGISILFGAILLRDGMTLFLNVLTLYGLIYFLKRPSIRSISVAIMLTVFAGVCMLYLRPQSTYLFGLFWLMALACWYVLGRATTAHALATLAIPVVFLAASAYLVRYAGASFELLQDESQDYVSLAAGVSRDDSLGMALVVKQPLPIRATLGSGVVLAFPIPLWTYVKEGASEYELIKTWQGVFKLLLVPLFLVGAGSVFYRTLQKREKLPALTFLTFYTVLMLVAVGATSLETRHFGQFMPAVILLAVIPDTREVKPRAAAMTAAFLWGGVLIAVHLAWAAMRFT